MKTQDRQSTRYGPCILMLLMKRGEGHDKHHANLIFEGTAGILTAAAGFVITHRGKRKT